MSPQRKAFLPRFKAENLRAVCPRVPLMFFPLYMKASSHASVACLAFSVLDNHPTGAFPAAGLRSAVRRREVMAELLCTAGAAVEARRLRRAPSLS